MNIRPLADNVIVERFWRSVKYEDIVCHELMQERRLSA